MKKITIVMMLLSVCSKFFGFAREIVLSKTYGASVVSDAFLYSYSLPATLFSVIIAAFVTGFIPMFTRIKNEEGSDNSILFANNVQNVMIVIALVFAIVFILFTDVFLAILVPSASPELLNYLIPFTRVTIFTLLTTCIIQIMTGFLNIHESFIFPLALAFPTNIILIASILISKHTSEYIMPFGILLAYFVQAALILWYANRKGFKISFKINLKDPNLKAMLVLAIPLIIGSATTSIGTVVNQALASGIDGGISQITYAAKIGGIVEGVFGLAIISVMYPALSKAVSIGNMEDASKEFESALSSLLFFIVPCAIGMAILAKPIVQFIYMRGEFGMEEVLVLTPIFRAYSLGLVGFSAYGLLARVFYSFQDTKTPMYTSILLIGTQIILGLLLSNRMGLHGITLAMTIANAIGSIILLVLSFRKFENFNYKKLLTEVIKIFVAGLLMGFVAYVIYGFVGNRFGNTMSLLSAIGAGVIVYFAMVYILKINVLVEFIGQIKNKK